MQRPRKILVPVDLSARSQVAVDHAVMLAAALGSEVVLVTNINVPERAALEDFAHAESCSIEDAAAVAQHQMVAALDSEVSTKFVSTSRDFPAEAILDVADSEDVDMIVLASHGRSGVTRWMLGSIAEKVSRHATVPVVIVPARN